MDPTLIAGIVAAIIGLVAMMFSKSRSRPEHRQPPTRSDATARAAEEWIDEQAAEESERIRDARDGGGKKSATVLGAMYPPEDEP